MIYNNRNDYNNNNNNNDYHNTSNPNNIVQYTIYT